MRKRDEKKNRREIVHSLAMILQIGLAMITCMGMSLAIGYYIDRLFGTKIWLIIMMVIGIMASFRSLLVLTGHYHPGRAEKEEDTDGGENGNSKD